MYGANPASSVGEERQYYSERGQRGNIPVARTKKVSSRTVDVLDELENEGHDSICHQLNASTEPPSDTPH
jgi:hypothetical protein